MSQIHFPHLTPKAATEAHQVSTSSGQAPTHGSTSHRSKVFSFSTASRRLCLCLSMNSTISVVGGRAPLRRKSLQISGFRSPDATPDFSLEASATPQIPHSASPAECRVNLRSSHPVVDSLRRSDPKFPIDGFHRSPLGRVLCTDFRNEPHRPLTHLRRVASRTSRHDPVLPKRWRLRQTRGDSSRSLIDLDSTGSTGRNDFLRPHWTRRPEVCLT
jgi:hypothetical protein